MNARYSADTGPPAAAFNEPVSSPVTLLALTAADHVDGVEFSLTLAYAVTVPTLDLSDWIRSVRHAFDSTVPNRIRPVSIQPSDTYVVFCLYTPTPLDVKNSKPPADVTWEQEPPIPAGCIYLVDNRSIGGIGVGWTMRRGATPVKSEASTSLR